jgi:Spy/CpxP family protein refolding chaperone
MTKSTKAIFGLAFVLAIGAGMALGMLTARATPAPADQRSNWFVDQLQLTAAQQRQMEEIWGALMREKGRAYGEEFRQLQAQRETDIAGMMSSDQRGQYDQINQKYAMKGAELWKRFEQEFVHATEKTRQILNEAQRVKFDAMIEQFRASRGGGNGWGSGPSTPPATAPSIQQGHSNSAEERT